MASSNRLQYIQYYSHADHPEVNPDAATVNVRERLAAYSQQSARPMRQLDFLKPSQTDMPSFRIANTQRAKTLYDAQDQRSRLRPVSSMANKPRAPATTNTPYGPYGRFYSDAERAEMDRVRDQRDRPNVQPTEPVQRVDARVRNLNQGMTQTEKPSIPSSHRTNTRPIDCPPRQATNRERQLELYASVNVPNTLRPVSAIPAGSLKVAGPHARFYDGGWQRNEPAVATNESPDASIETDSAYGSRAASPVAPYNMVTVKERVKRITTRIS